MFPCWRYVVTANDLGAVPLLKKKRLFFFCFYFVLFYFVLFVCFFLLLFFVSFFSFLFCNINTFSFGCVMIYTAQFLEMF